MFGYIYLTVNKINGRFYIGQEQGEFTAKYLGSGRILQLAVARHGRDAFTVEQVKDTCL